MTRKDLAGIPDGGTLQVLKSGLEVVRRTKHEPVDFAKLSRAELERRTDKRDGSKFLADWNLDRLVDWIENAAGELGWVAQPFEPDKHDFRFEVPVGYFRGKKVHTIRIVKDGRCIHAYPVEDQ